MLELVGIVAPFFMVIMLGFLAGRLGVFRLDSAKVFNNYLLYFALPAMFLSKLLEQDVLSGFETIKVCTAYHYQGKQISHLPYSIEAHYLTPVYREMAGWKEDLTGMTKASELPKELRAYISFLEEELEVPISIVSVGPDRTQTIHR